MESELKRQTAYQDAIAQGSGRSQRLDPAEMPHRFATRGPVPGQAGETASLDVYIDRVQVIVKRRLGGLPLTMAQPVSAYLGVFAEVSPGAEPGTFAARIGLLHRDRDQSIELARGDAFETMAADWRAWAEALDLPLLLLEADGHVTRLDGPATMPRKRQTTRPTGVVTRRKVAALTARRPRFLNRRKAGRMDVPMPVYLGEREIIARN